LADAPLSEALSAAALAVARLFIALNDLFDPFADEFRIVCLAMLPRAGS
jgi:hypothetical protein